MSHTKRFRPFFGGQLVLFGAGFRLFVFIDFKLVSEGADELAVGIEHLQLEDAGGIELLGQVIVQQHAAGMVLAGVLGMVGLPLPSSR